MRTDREHVLDRIESPLNPFAVRLDDPAARAIPRVHIHCTDVPEGFSRRPLPTHQRNGDPEVVWELPTGHDCMITTPGALAELLLRLA